MFHVMEHVMEALHIVLLVEHLLIVTVGQVLTISLPLIKILQVCVRDLIILQ